jgi:hypothetical protein
VTQETLRVGAVHLGGVLSIKPGQRELELRFSDTGLDILAGQTGALLGRLAWAEVKSLELGHGRRGWLRRRTPELVIQTERGRASFELTGLTRAQLKEHVEPVLAYARDHAGQ